MQSDLQSDTPDPLWEQISPMLDEALASLNQKDRQAVLLRFFENKNLAEVGRTLGSAENTAGRRISRALEKLRRFFVKRGIASTTALIAGTISANSVHAAPAALVKTITVAGVAKGAVAGGSTLTLIKGALEIMAWTKAKTALVAAATIIVATGTVTVAIKTGGFGIGHSNKGGSSATLANAENSPKIFSNGINNAHTLQNALYTYPAGDEKTHRYVDAVVKKFRPNLDPSRVVKSDLEVTETDIQTRTIYIYGSPENHKLFQRVRDQLPILFEDDGIVVGSKKYVGRDVGAIFVCPNPLSPKNLLVIYGTVSPEALDNMNSIYHGPTDYIVFNNATRQFSKLPDADRYLLLGAFDKSDPTHWRVDESLELAPPKDLRRVVSQVLAAR